jgi:hypothetical protein
LLILTFHKPGSAGAGTCDEDLLFKRHALDSTLVDVDAMEAAGPPDKDLFKLESVPDSGLAQASDSAGKPLVTFNSVGAAAWGRQAFQSAGGTPSLFDQWMRKVLSTPIECLVLAGHHSLGELWGLEAVVGASHRPYSKFVPNPAAKTIEVRGHARGGASPEFLRGGPYDVSTALKTCRLVLVWGCNGASDLRSHWKPWHDLVRQCSSQEKSPVILGHYETHRWPRDNATKKFSPDFWSRLATLAKPNGTITSLCEDRPLEVIDVWIAAMKEAFATSTQCNQHMFFQRRHTKTCKGYGPRGAGAVAPDGQPWHVVDESGKREPR